MVERPVKCLQLEYKYSLKAFRLAYALLGMNDQAPATFYILKTMKKLLSILAFLLVSSFVIGQTPGRVDKKTKEFIIASNQKTEYQIFGYQYPNISTKKMICFSTHAGDVRDNYNKCPLGSYFDTNLMKEGDRIIYLGPTGKFAKMNYLSGAGKKTIFYLPKSSFTIR